MLGSEVAGTHFPAEILWTLEWVFRGYVGIHRDHKAIQVDGCRPRRMSHRFPLALSYPEPLRVTGPPPSLVLWTEDMWWRHNQCHRSERGSQSGFPLLTPIEGGVMQLSHFICQTLWNTSFYVVTLCVCVLSHRCLIGKQKKPIQGDDCRLRRVSWLRFPWLPPIRNSKQRNTHCCVMSAGTSCNNL